MFPILSKLGSVTNMLSNLGGNRNGETPGAGDPSMPNDVDWFHRAMNRISRLPRLVLLFMIIAMLIWPIVNPDAFMKWTAAITTMPENLWLLVFLIVGSWAGSKAVRDFRSRTSFTTYTNVQHDYPGGDAPDDLPDGSPMDDDLFLDDMEVGHEPNSAIEEWRNEQAR